MNDVLLGMRQVLLGSRDDLLSKGNVVATGIGFKETDGTPTGELSIVCSVTRKVPTSQLASSDLVPKTIAGLRTDVVQTGAFRALADPHKSRRRPACGGLSIGHKAITAGTLGCVVRRGAESFILSNNHVLADSNRAARGDEILQPAAYDGGRLPDDLVARLEDYVPISVGEQESTCAVASGAARLLSDAARLFGSDARLRAYTVATNENLVDAAIARPIRVEDIETAIMDIGTPSGTAEGALGMAVRKSGRSTGYTTGEIVQVDVTADIDYDGRTARFTDQLMCGAMSEGGDSGSVVVDESGHLVGLLFAGSDSTTLMNRIDNVFEALEISL